MHLAARSTPAIESPAVCSRDEILDAAIEARLATTRQMLERRQLEDEKTRRVTMFVVLTGNLQPSAGGAILAHATSRSELEERVGEDPFVAQNVVSAEIHEITPSRVDERLAFLRA